MLVKNAAVLATMDAGRREIPGGGLFIRDGKIEQVGPTADLPGEADEVLDLGGHVVLPGLVNTHHHLYQTLFRVVPAAEDGNVFNWLKTLYTMWARMTPRGCGWRPRPAWPSWSLTGCTTVFDHSYVFPNGCRVDDQIPVAREMGVRFHVSRGSMSLGKSKGGLPPDSCVEDEAGHPQGLPAGHRGLSRPRARRDDPDRPGAVLAVLGDARPDEGIGQDGPRVQGPSAYAPGRVAR